MGIDKTIQEVMFVNTLIWVMKSGKSIGWGIFYSSEQLSQRGCREKQGKLHFENNIKWNTFVIKHTLDIDKIHTVFLPDLIA